MATTTRLLWPLLLHSPAHALRFGGLARIRMTEATPAVDETFDLIIVGGGSAGLTAANFAAWALTNDGTCSFEDMGCDL